jgi:hypothetical protein
VKSLDTLELVNEVDSSDTVDPTREIADLMGSQLCGMTWSQLKSSDAVGSEGKTIDSMRFHGVQWTLGM